jgi:hypothetical protein
MPNKYEAFSDLFRLGMCEAKALLFLRYDADPEKMDYKAIEDRLPAHDMSNPARPEDIAKKTGCSKHGMYMALKECHFHGLASRRRGRPTKFGAGNTAMAYFLDEEQNGLIRRMEKLAVKYYDIRTR